MTAGSGIAHAEETPTENSGTLNGVQLWVALPDAQRGAAPAFHHYSTLPIFETRGGYATVLLGSLENLQSDADAFSPMLGADVAVHPNQEISLPLNRAFEYALVAMQGDVTLEGQPIALDTLYYLGIDRDALSFRSTAGARVMLIGGEPFRESILMWWNFVARTEAEIAAARADWEQHRRFADVRVYKGSRLKAPSIIGKLRPSK
jgi:redox-sensitive bicupin YhaK (pirin superfamily)